MDLVGMHIGDDRAVEFPQSLIGQLADVEPEVEFLGERWLHGQTDSDAPDSSHALSRGTTTYQRPARLMIARLDSSPFGLRL